MGTTYRFLATGHDLQRVYDWFAGLPDAPDVVPARECSFLHFRHLGGLGYRSNTDEVDPKRSPIASLFPPENKRAILWTAGELHFLPTPLAKVFPKLHNISRQFAKWLQRFDQVAESGKTGEWDYYLEGSLKNWGTPIYALPEAMSLLRGGQYFVSHSDNDSVLDTLCRSLRLRRVGGPDGV